MTACTHDRCQQGRKPCPTAQACQVAEPALQYARAEEQRDSVEHIGKWAIRAIFALTLVGIVAISAGYFSVRL